MFPLPTHKACRRGVTMIELLVVVGILVMLAAISIPAFRAAPEGRAVREATRGGNVYFGNARHRAMETGRPCGVMLERRPEHPHACVKLSQVEAPPPFAGHLPSAVVRVMDYTHTADSSWSSYPFYSSIGCPVVKVMVREGDFASRLIRHGDLIRLDHQGPWYRIIYDANTGWPSDFPVPSLPDFPPEPSPYDAYIWFDPPGKAVAPDALGNVWITSHLLTLVADPLSGYQPPFPKAKDYPNVTWVFPPERLPRVPFQIFRQPAPTSVKPLSLSGAVIDLAASGFDRPLPDSGTAEVARTFEPDTPADLRPVIVMFSPNGSVEGVYYSQRVYDQNGNFDHCEYAGRRLIEPIHFLVGKYERLPVTLRRVNVDVPDSMAMHPSKAEDGVFNRQDAGNLWLTLNPQTGLATVAELHADLPPGSGPTAHPTMYVPSGATLTEQLIVARRFAREAQISKGGR